MNINEKLTAIQAEIKAPKNLVNSFGGYKYRNAEGILEAFKPYAVKYNVNLTVSDDIILVGERVYVKAIARIQDNESEGFVETNAFAREPLDKKGSDASQITGASSSYARKYALNGLLLLDDTKDPDTDEDTARRKGMSAQDLSDHKQDKAETEDIRRQPLPPERIEIFMKLLTDNGLNAKDVYKHYGIKKKADLTYEIETLVNSDMKELVRLYGSGSQTA